MSKIREDTNKYTSYFYLYIVLLYRLFYSLLFSLLSSVLAVVASASPLPENPRPHEIFRRKKTRKYRSYSHGSMLSRWLLTCRCR